MLEKEPPPNCSKKKKQLNKSHDETSLHKITKMQKVLHLYCIHLRGYIWTPTGVEDILLSTLLPCLHSSMNFSKLFSGNNSLKKHDPISGHHATQCKHKCIHRSQLWGKFGILYLTGQFLEETGKPRGNLKRCRIHMQDFTHTVSRA